MVATRSTNDVTNGFVEGLNKAIGHMLVKVVEELIPPVAQSIHKLAQVLVAGSLRPPYPFICFCHIQILPAALPGPAAQ